MMIDIDVSEIVAKSLRNDIECLENTKENILSTGKASGYVSWDNYEKDLKAVKKTLKNLKGALKYYGG